MTETELRLDRLVAYLRSTHPAQAVPSLDEPFGGPQPSMSLSNSDERLGAFQYVVEIKQPSHGTTFYRSGHGISEKDRSEATIINGYLPTLRLITEILAHFALTQPVEICIKPAPIDAPWTVEEILAHAG